MKEDYELEHWYEQCPMLYGTYKKFFASGKKFIYVYIDSNNEYCGSFFENKPPEDIFIQSYNYGDICGAIFERDFTKNVDINDHASLESALILVDEDIFDKNEVIF